jgi:hypothetical protein
MFHYKSNTLSVYFFLLFFKLIIAATFATAQGAGTPSTGGPDPNPTASLPPNNRTTHYNQIGWYAFLGTIKLVWQMELTHRIPIQAQ